MARGKALLILRAGRSTLHESWIHVARQSIDIIASIYDGSDFESANVIKVHHCPGGKYQAVSRLFVEHPGLLNEYEYFWFVDDDMFIPCLSIHNLIATASKFRFPICQPAVSIDSFFSWPMTVANSRFIWRGTDFVEIMCPFMHRDFLNRAIKHMDHTFTGWGQEFIWREILRDDNEVGAIIDAAPVVHTRPVGGGAIYNRYVDGKAGAFREALVVLERLGIVHNPNFKQYFGLKSGDPATLIHGEQFLQEVLLGYEAVKNISEEAYRCCIADARQRIDNSGSLQITQRIKDIASEFANYSFPH